VRIHRLVLAESLRRLGVAGATGFVLLVLAALGGLFVLVPAREHFHVQEQRILDAQARLERLRSGEGVESSGTHVSRLYDALPGQQTATAAIDRIYAAAEQEGLSLARGEYSLVVEPGMGLAQYQILLPVHGTYPQIRRFVGTALEAVPALGLDDVALQRKNIGDAQVDARLRMTLHLSRQP